MPRLTRTQKFADLREQLANSKEETISTQELKTYEDKFNNVQDTLAPQPTPETKPEYVWDDFKEENSFAEVDNTPWDIKEVPVVEEPVETVEEITVQEVPAEEKPFETINSYFDSFTLDTNDEPQKTTKDFSSYFEKNNEELNAIIDDNFPGVFNDVSDDSGEIVSQKERDTYLNQTFSDVNSYNINNGQLTIDQLVDNSVEEVRHGEEITVEKVEETSANAKDTWAGFTDENKTEEVLDADKIEEETLEVETVINDEEFSNTVSLEITKIMDELAKAPEIEEVAPVVEEEPIVEETSIAEETINVETPLVEEKPEEVVEIKNISEIDNEPETNTMSSTIPFIVAEKDEELAEEDEDEEDGSNTVLNVILIVLIVILVAVLGLIVFYILKTKGIF